MWLGLWITVADAVVVQLVALPHGKLVGTPGHVTRTNDGFCSDYGGDSACKAECKARCNQPAQCLEKAERLRTAARAAIPPDSEYDVIFLITPRFEHVVKGKSMAADAAAMYVGDSIKGYGLEYEIYEPSYDIAEKCNFQKISTGGKLGYAEGIPLTLGFHKTVPDKGRKPLMIYTTGIDWIGHWKRGKCLRTELDNLQDSLGQAVRVLVLISGDLSQNHQPLVCNPPVTYTGHGLLHTGDQFDHAEVPAKDVPGLFDSILASWPVTLNYQLLSVAKMAIKINNSYRTPMNGKPNDSALNRPIMKMIKGGDSGMFPVSAMTCLQVVAGMLERDREGWDGSVSAYEVPTYTGMMVAKWTRAKYPWKKRVQTFEDPGSTFSAVKSLIVPVPTTSTSQTLRSSSPSSLSEVGQRHIRPIREEGLAE